MGSCCSNCHNSNQQFLSDSVYQKELINQEGNKQPFKPPIILSFVKKQKPGNDELPKKQYQGDYHPILQIGQKEIEEVVFFDENYTTTMNQFKYFDEWEQLFNESLPRACQSSLSNSGQLKSENSNNSLPQKKKKKKRKHRSKEANVKDQTHKYKGKQVNSIFCQNHNKEIPNQLQQLLMEYSNDKNLEESLSLKSILKKTSGRKVQSHSPSSRHVSFAKR